MDYNIKMKEKKWEKESFSKIYSEILKNQQKYCKKLVFVVKLNYKKLVFVEKDENKNHDFVYNILEVIYL